PRYITQDVMVTFPVFVLTGALPDDVHRKATLLRPRLIGSDGNARFWVTRGSCSLGAWTGYGTRGTSGAHCVEECLRQADGAEPSVARSREHSQHLPSPARQPRHRMEDQVPARCKPVAIGLEQRRQPATPEPTMAIRISAYPRCQVPQSRRPAFYWKSMDGYF